MSTPRAHQTRSTLEQAAREKRLIDQWYKLSAAARLTWYPTLEQWQMIVIRDAFGAPRT